MNLQALYDLKERLEYSAIAGTGLLQEDFRLKRAAECLAPLAAASLVFAKISTSVKALLEASSDERSKQLLDVLSLVDAVAYTQGTTGIAGDMISINTDKNNPFIGKYIHASYAQLQPLITALTTTGSGRMAIIEECKNNHPEYFGDFRVLPYVVKSLGDSYSEIPDLICAILEGQGKSVVPLLKEGFEPDGKKDMVRRATLIWNISGSDENDWYISVLPEAKKEIREIIIKALGDSKDNEQLLLDLYNSEKGKAKEAVLYALAKMDTPECAAYCKIYWKKELDKNLKRVKCLIGIDSQIAADMSAYGVQKHLGKIFQEGSINCNFRQQMELSEYAEALVGKYSEKIYDFWLWIAEQLSKLPDNAVGATTVNIKGEIPTYMLRTILCKPCEKVFELAKVLAEKYPKYFMNCAFLVDLIQLEPESVYEKYSHYILDCSTESKETPEQKIYRLQLMQIFYLVHWNEEKNIYELEFSEPYDGDDYYEPPYSFMNIPGLDKRWLELFVDNKLSRQGTIFDINQLYKVTSFMDEILQHILNKEEGFEGVKG